MAKNTNLIKARKAKDDEFYTREVDFEKEIITHLPEIKDKIIYLNCDSGKSRIYLHLRNHFTEYGLKKIIVTGLSGVRIDYTPELTKLSLLSQGGGFDTQECKDIIQECDIIITNPPFSLGRDYADLVLGSSKKFLFLLSNNSVCYKNIFKAIVDNKIRPGNYSFKPMKFDRPDGSEKSVNCIWWTNLDVLPKSPLELTKSYDPQIHRVYDNYCAINCDKVKDIPKDEYIEIEIPDEDYEIWKRTYGDDLEII